MYLNVSRIGNPVFFIFCCDLPWTVFFNQETEAQVSNMDGATAKNIKKLSLRFF